MGVGNSVNVEYRDLVMVRVKERGIICIIAMVCIILIECILDVKDIISRVRFLGFI